MASVVVFDMGGVLYDFQGDQLIARTSRRARRWRSEEVQRKWIPLAHRFETGACSASEFAAEVVHAYDLQLDAAAFLSAFHEAAVGFYDGALSLVREIGQRHRVVSLSNTNPVQWPAVLAHVGESDPFHGHFPSHLSGFHKPDRRAFETVTKAHGVEARVYFLDDRTQNITAATELGWSARRARGVSEARHACVELGLLD